MSGRSFAKKLHRRIELVVAVISVVAVTVILASTDHAAAQLSEATPPGPAPAGESELEDPGVADEPAEPAEPEDPAETEVEPAGQEDPVASRERRNRGPRIKRAKASPSRIFLGSRRRAAFHFELAGNHSRRLLVKIVKVKTGKVKKRFRLGTVSPGQRQRVAWDGKLGGKGGFASPGEHAFRVFAAGERAAVSRDGSSQRFDFYEHRFPLLGRHTYGDGFGAGRGHQGQDIFARCGTRVAAARGGRIQTKAYQSSAGYYVVVDGRGTGKDYVYMHLERGDRPPDGSWVSTGETIGHESDTGNASGCHLHFELWTKPGWYEGGHAKSPTGALKRWDSWS